MVRPLKVGGTVIANRVVFAVLAFVFLYFMSIVTLIFVQLASGLDFMTSLSAILACINNAGPGLGLVGPGSNYGVLSDFQTWVCSAAMLLGRLEVFTILVLIHADVVAEIDARQCDSHPILRELPPGEEQQRRGNQVKARAGQNRIAQRFRAEAQRASSPIPRRSTSCRVRCR